MRFGVINKKTNRIVRPRNYCFVVKENGELWTIKNNGDFTKASHNYKVITEGQIHPKDTNDLQKQILPLYGIRHHFSKERPPKNVVVMFVWWNKISFESSKKTLGYLNDDNVLIVDKLPAGDKNPTYWHYLNTIQ